jgi:hypothetical protein
MAVTSAARLARPRRWPGVLAWTLWTLAMLALVAAIWLHNLLVQAGRPGLMTLEPLLVVAAVSAATVGAVVATRRPAHPVGWLLLAFGLFLGASGVTAAYGPYGLLVRPGALPAASLVAWYYPAFATASLACMGFVMLLTPTGSLPSPRWRWWAGIAAAAPLAGLLAVPLALPPPGSYQALDSPFDFHTLHGALLVIDQVALAVTVLAILVAAGSLVVRFRRARGVERQQLRWVALAAGLVVLGAAVAVLAFALGATGLIGTVEDVASQFCVAVLPVAVGAAVLRYRLYDLDRIVSRTLAYGLLTVLLGGGYAGVVLGLGQLLGRSSSLAVAVATLAVAAVFQPARRRVQELAEGFGGPPGAAAGQPDRHRRPAAGRGDHGGGGGRDRRLHRHPRPPAAPGRAGPGQEHGPGTVPLPSPATFYRLMAVVSAGRFRNVTHYRLRVLLHAGGCNWAQLGT